jgi:stress-induced-phosphoprotein 1
MKEYSKCMETCDEALEVDAEHHAGKHRQEIEGQKQKALFTIYGGAQHDSNESPEERLKKAMQDPKVQEILSDPFMRTLLDQMAQNPEAAREHMKNPKIRENVGGFTYLFILVS